MDHRWTASLFELLHEPQTQARARIGHILGWRQCRTLDLLHLCRARFQETRREIRVLRWRGLEHLESHHGSPYHVLSFSCVRVSRGHLEARIRAQCSSLRIDFSLLSDSITCCKYNNLTLIKFSFVISIWFETEVYDAEPERPHHARQSCGKLFVCAYPHIIKFSPFYVRSLGSMSFSLCILF